MAINFHGRTTTHRPDQFASELFYSECSGEMRVQWDYRDRNGKLHSGVARNLDAAIQAAIKYGYQPESR